MGKPIKTSKTAVAQVFKTEEEAMAHLRHHYPAFFKDETSRRVAAAVIKVLVEYLGPMSPINQAGCIAGIMALMYQMGSAAIEATKQPKTMGLIFAEKYEAEHRTDGT